MWMSLASSSHISGSLPQALRCDRKVILEPNANVPPLIFHAVPLGSCFPQSLSVASIAFAFSLFSPRYNPFLKEKGLPYAYGQALEAPDRRQSHALAGLTGNGRRSDIRPAALASRSGNPSAPGSWPASGPATAHRDKTPGRGGTRGRAPAPVIRHSGAGAPADPGV